MIHDNLLQIQKTIQTTCLKVGRAENEITLVGVTKFSEAEQIDEAIKTGLQHIAENRVQVAKNKFPQIKRLAEVSKHLIGHLQSNKVKQAVEMFDLIHSIDSIKLLDMVQKHAIGAGKVMDVLIQLNMGEEVQKHGADKGAATLMLDHARELSHVHVRGLMTMAPLTDDEALIRQCFRGLKQIYDVAQEQYRGSDNINMDYLSMGMSGDYPIAIEEGANMVRIGSAIFNRDYRDRG